MPLTQVEKAKITEDETLRFEARMKAHEKLGMKGGSCGICGHRHGCRGCRTWAWVVGALILICFLRMVVMHSGYCSRDGHGMMGWDAQHSDVPNSDSQSQMAPKPPTK